MKLRATTTGFESVLRRLRQHGLVAARAAGAASATSLVSAIERARDAEGISAPLARRQKNGTHFVGVDDARAADREFGTLTQEPTPWLAPVLPAARGPMRAAAEAGEAMVEIARHPPARKDIEKRLEEGSA